MQDENYPVSGMNKIYKKGINFIIDSFAHTNQKDITDVRDSVRSLLYENEDTPLDGFEQPKLLIHNKNEIPQFLGPYKKYFTVGMLEKGYYREYVGEVKIPLEVILITIRNLD